MRSQKANAVDAGTASSSPDPFAPVEDHFGLDRLDLTPGRRPGLARRDQPDDANPVFHAYLRAYLRVMDAGKPVTHLNVAKAMGFKSRESVYRLQRKYPTLHDWVMERLSRNVDREIALVRSKLAAQAVFGSVKAAETLRRFEEMRMPGRGGRYGEMENPAAAGLGGFTINMLLPRPPEPALPAGMNEGPIRVPAAVLDQPPDLGAQVAQATAEPSSDADAETPDPLAAVVLEPVTRSGR